MLSTGDGEGEFLVNEFRCPIFVTDVVRVVELLIAKHADGGMKLVLNLGGPDRLSRSDMADIVAQVRGYKMELVNRVSTLSVSTLSKNLCILLANILELSLLPPKIGGKTSLGPSYFVL